MDKKRWIILLVLAATSVMMLSSCRIDVSRNPDGSLRAEVAVSEATIQSEIAAALADPLITNMQVDLRQGYAFVSGDRKRVLSEETDTMTFRLTLGVQSGHLTATISDVEVNDTPVNPAYISVWNDRIATRLEAAARRFPNSTLQAVSVSGDALHATWRIETARSRGQ